jgi:hypothetical protein
MKSSQITHILFWLVISLLIGAADAKAQKAGDLKLAPYVFEAANKQQVDAELGKLLVPENRKNPKSRLIELAFVRFKYLAKPWVADCLSGGRARRLRHRRRTRHTLPRLYGDARNWRCHCLRPARRRNVATPYELQRGG